MLTSVPLEEVQLLVSPPTTAPGNRMREYVLSFEALSSRIQLTQLCKKAYFQYRVTARKKYKIRPDRDDGWGTITPRCQEYTFSRSFPRSQAVDHFWKFESWKFLMNIEIANQPLARLANASYVVISRETERFVNEIHDHKQELRSSNELLTAFQKSERREPYGEERGSNSIRATCALNSNRETCANPLSNPISDSLFKKTVIPSGERKWITIDANAFTKERFAYTGIQGDHEDGSSSWSWWPRTRRIISLGDRAIGICTGKSRRFFWQLLDSSYSWKAAVRKELNTAWITRSPCVIYELFRDTLVVFQ